LFIFDVKKPALTKRNEVSLSMKSVLYNILQGKIENNFVYHIIQKIKE